MTGLLALLDDIAAIAACRSATSPHIHLMVDFNQGLSRAQALERCHALDDQGLTWFEEPIVYDDYAGFAQLRQELKTPLQIGENVFGPRELLQVVEARAADYLMPDLMRMMNPMLRPTRRIRMPVQTRELTRAPRPTLGTTRRWTTWEPTPGIPAMRSILASDVRAMMSAARPTGVTMRSVAAFRRPTE